MYSNTSCELHNSAGKAGPSSSMYPKQQCASQGISPAVPTISVIIPVWHEQERINEAIVHVRKVAATSAQNREHTPTVSSSPTACANSGLPAEGRYQAETGFVHGVEIIVADGAPQSTTLAAITCKDVRTVSAPQGRAVQMNSGARLARGDILCFLHVDTILPNKAFTYIRQALEPSFAQLFAAVSCAPPDYTAGKALTEAGSCCQACRQMWLKGEALQRSTAHSGAFSLAIDGRGCWLRTVELVANWRNRLTRTPYGDQVQFFRAAYFRMLGGYAHVPIMEDVDIMRRIRQRGDTLALLPHTVHTSARRWQAEGQFYCTLRNICLRFLYGTGVSAKTLARWYRAFRE